MKKPKRKAAKTSVKKTAKKTAKKPIKAVAKKSPVKKSAAKKVAKKAIIKKSRVAAKPQYSFNWHDLMTPDVEGAKAFYGEVVGWNFSHQPPDYHVTMVGQTGVGGIMATPAELGNMPPFWSGYIAVKNVDKACAQLKKLGGKVHREPYDIPDTLRMAVVSDPSGGMFNMYTPMPRGVMKPAAQGATGTVGWNELMTTDVASSAKFYNKMFGWGKGHVHDMGPQMGKYHLMQVKKKDHAGMMNKSATMPRDFWGFYFYVHGIDAAAERIKSHGGKVINGPMQVPTGSWIVQGQDPQGAHFSLMSKTK